MPDDDRAMDWADQFKAFAQRKTHEAERAHLSPLKTLIEEPPPGFEPIGDAWTRGVFDGRFYLAPVPSDIPATSLVFVRSKDGNTAARNPAVLGGGETDKHLIYEGLSRVASDGVLSGAETIRGGNVAFSVWHPDLVQMRLAIGLPRHPTQIVATLRGLPLEDALLFNVPELPVIVVTVRASAERMRRQLEERPWVTTIDMAEPTDLRPAFRRLRDTGMMRISCIGGRTIARALLDVHLAQDLYLTTSARTGGEANTPLTDMPLDGRVIARKEGTGPDQGVVFEHIALT